LVYGGERIASGEMDAAAVAHSILTFGRFIGIVAESVHTPEVEVRTTVRGIQSGSFDIAFGIHLAEAAGVLFAAKEVNLPEVIKSVLDLLKHLNGRKPAKATHEGTKVTIENNNGNVIVVEGNVYSAAMNPETGTLTQGFVRDPLQTIAESIEVRSDSDRAPMRIEASESSAFGPLRELDQPDEQEIIQNEVTTILELTKPDLKGNSKWKFHDGRAAIQASMGDKGFLDKVRKHEELFGSGDRLKVRMISTQTVGEKVFVSHEIVRVLEHRRPQIEPELPMDT
jgi:hypothetical protein